MKIREIREKTDLSRADFSREFHIPIRTLENWESGKSSCPAYVKDFLARCAVGDAAGQKINDVMSISEIIDLTKLSRENFANKYHIPERTIVEWIAGRRHSPQYVLELLQQCVKYDDRARWYIYRKGYEITGGQTQNILGVYDVYGDAFDELTKIKRDVMDGKYDDEWGIKNEERKKAGDSLSTTLLEAHELV